MTDLADFLLARIAEDEALARTASPGPWQVAIDKQSQSHPHVTDSQDRSVLDGAAEFAADQWLDATDQDLLHIVRWHPARVLAECEAKRRIVEFYGGPVGQMYVLQFLALPYAGHPDYREEWRP